MCGCDAMAEINHENRKLMMISVTIPYFNTTPIVIILHYHMAIYYIYTVVGLNNFT